MIKVTDSIVSQTFEVEVLTPTHIGGASENHWQKDLDFIIKDNKTWILDFKKLCTVIDSFTLANVLSRENANQTLGNLLVSKNLETISSSRFDSTFNNSSEIKRHIFNGFDGKPYIPGSSIKGAINSILLNYFYRNSTQAFQKNNKIAEQVLGNFENSIMRFFQFTDIHFTETFLINTKIFNLQNSNGQGWTGGWKHSRNETNNRFQEAGFTTVYESLQSFSKGSLMISFKRGVIERLYAEALKNNRIKLPPVHTAAWLTKNPAEQLCQIINTHTLRFLEKEIAFFDNYNFDKNTESVLSKLNELKAKVERLKDDSKECILRLSAGSGFHSITGDWQYDNFIDTGENQDGRNRGKRKYKSRKLAFQTDSKGSLTFQPMGFIKLTLLDEETKLKLQHEEALKKMREAQKAEAETKEEAERLEREKAEKEEAKKPKLFDDPLPKSKTITVDAIIAKSGKPNLVKLFVKGYENKEFPLLRYTNPLEKDTVLLVKASTKKDGSIYEVVFEKVK